MCRRESIAFCKMQSSVFNPARILFVQTVGSLLRKYFYPGPLTLQPKEIRWIGIHLHWLTIVLLLGYIADIYLKSLLLYSMLVGDKLFRVRLLFKENRLTV